MPDASSDDPLPGAPLTALGPRMARITQEAGIGYWSVNLRQRSGHWSPELRALHGLGAHDPLPLPDEWVARFVHPDDRDATRRVLMNWLAGRTGRLEHALRIVRADGSVRELLTHSLAEAGDDADLRFGVAIDVTPLRRAERALREAEGRVALTASAVGMATWEFDLQTQVVRWDDAMWRLRGLGPRPQPPRFAERVALLHPDDRERVAEINRSNRSESYEFRVVWPDGQVRWLAARSTLLRDEFGRPQRRIGINWDITDQRKVEAALREREIALRESQARGRTLARMSHDLRTPLNAILGCIQLLRADGGADPVLRERHLAGIEDAGRVLLAMVDRVLDLSTPAAEGPAAQPAVGLAPPERRTLLYVEDNEVNAMIVRELVARRGDIEVLVAGTGADGLRLAAERQPALVLLDMQLPDIDGPEVFRRLRAHPCTAALPCVALSANAMQEDIDAALAAGMSGYWTKPLDFRAFEQSLQAIFGPPPAA